MTLPDSPDSGRRLPQPPELEAEFEILQELGRGGTAVVYLARDRALDRHVALKIIRATFVEDEEAVARLQREARTYIPHPRMRAGRLLRVVERSVRHDGSCAAGATGSTVVTHCGRCLRVCH